MTPPRGRRSQHWPFWAAPVLLMVVVLAVFALADWWRTWRGLHRLAQDPVFTQNRWKALLDYKSTLYRLAAGRMAQRWAVRHAVGSAQSNVSLMSAWAICASGQQDADAGRVVVNEAMADMVVLDPRNRALARELAMRFFLMQLALREANGSVVAPLLEVATDQEAPAARRHLAIAALGLIGDPKVRAPLLDLLRSDPGDLRVHLFTAMAALQEREAAADLRRAALGDPDPEYRAVAAHAYQQLTGQCVPGVSTQPARGSTTQRD